jgi:hypothetical protein
MKDAYTQSMLSNRTIASALAIQHKVHFSNLKPNDTVELYTELSKHQKEYLHKIIQYIYSLNTFQADIKEKGVLLYGTYINIELIERVFTCNYYTKKEGDYLNDLKPLFTQLFSKS